MNVAWVRRGALAAAFGITITSNAVRAAERDPLSFAMTLPSPNALPVAGAPAVAAQTYRTHVRYVTGETLDFTYNSRDWFYAVDRHGPRTLRTYYTGGSVLYNSRDGATWEKIDYARLSGSPTSHGSHGAASTRDTAARSESARWLPDRTIAGTRYRTFGIFSPKPGSGSMLVVSCVVDKRNGLLRSCARPGVFSATFDHYGDPRNEFVLPAAARRARDVTLSFVTSR